MPIPNLRLAASRARIPSGITSFPIPSPGMTAILGFLNTFFVFICLQSQIVIVVDSASILTLLPVS